MWSVLAVMLRVLSLELNQPLVLTVVDGEVRFQQGFFSISKTCPRCQGQGTIVTDPCTQCSGVGTQRKTVDLELKIPAGVDTGQRMKLTGEGAPGFRGGPAGDLYVVIEVGPHESFERDGETIYCDVPIRVGQAAMGDRDHWRAG